MKRLVMLAALSTTMSALPALADVTITTVGDKDGKPWSVTYVAGGKVRSENLQGKDASFVLWQVGGQQMTIVMPSRKSYMVMDKAQVQAQMKQANDAVKQMEAQLAQMPPQMREMMKKNMPNLGTGKPLIEMKVTKTGRSDSKAGHACQVVDVVITGVPMAGPMGQEHCVVDPAKLGIPSGDMETIKAMAAFAKEMTKDLGQMVGGMPDVFEMGGWPVWTKDKQTGASWGLKTVTKGAVSGSLFSVPAGYKKEELPQLGAPGR